MINKLAELNGKKEYRWIAVIISSILYLAVSSFMLCKYYMAYSIDEFYALASLNPNAENIYRRHPYINKMVAWSGQHIDDNYYAGKLIPYVVGIICFAFIMLMLVAVCKTNLAVALGGFAYSLNSLIIFNHVYIRHYVFAELAFIMFAVGLYIFYSKRGNICFRIAMLFLGCLADYLYITQTNDDSIWGFEMFTVAVLVLLVLHKGIYYLFNNKIIRITVVSLVLVVLGGCVVFFGNSQMMQIIPPVFRVKFEHFKGDIPVFWLFAVCVFSYVIAALISFMFADNYNRMRDLYPVWILVFLASAAYIVAFPYNYLVRSFTPYVGVGIVFAIGFWDNIVEKKYIRVILAIVIVASTFLSYPNFEFRWFYTGGAGVYDETNLESYESIVNDVKTAQAEGYEVATMMSFTAQDYVLGINSDYAFSELGDNNEELMPPDEAAIEIKGLIAEGKKFVLMTSNFGGQLLDQTGLLEELKAQYDYKNYNSSSQYLIYIN